MRRTLEGGRDNVIHRIGPKRQSHRINGERERGESESWTRYEHPLQLTKDSLNYNEFFPRAKEANNGTLWVKGARGKQTTKRSTCQPNTSDYGDMTIG